MTHRVRDVMTRAVVVAHVDDPFRELVRLMRDYRVSAMPVLDARRRIVGVVSEADLLMKEDLGLLTPRLFDRVELEPEQGTRENVARSLMTKPAITVGPDAPITDAAHLMHEHRIAKLPVVDRQHHVVGIVSRIDLLGAFLRGNQAIEADVRTALTRDLFLPLEAISVSVDDGLVVLEGEVERRTQADGIVSRVRRIEGVSDIDDRLTWEWDDLMPAGSQLGRAG